MGDVEDQFADHAEALGYIRGSAEHGAMVVLLRHKNCQERHGVEDCEACPAHLECSLRFRAARLLAGISE